MIKFKASEQHTDEIFRLRSEFKRSAEQAAGWLPAYSYPFKVDLFLTSRFDPCGARSHGKTDNFQTMQTS